MAKKVIYFQDEKNDEFSTAQITARPIDENWVYLPKSKWKKFTHFFWYRVVATPLAFLYTKIVFHHKVEGREKLKPYRKSGCFLYGNHTQAVGDALMPSLIAFPKTCYCIVHPNNVSMPVLGKVTPSLGALPLPDDLKAYRNFIRAVKTRVLEKNAVVIYPEAHIWPYYTGIRPFSETSFSYPVRFGVPAFVFVNTYRKRLFGKRPRIVSCIDGPFSPDPGLSPREATVDLRNRVYDAMKRLSEKNEIEYYQYIKRK